jgi:predicted SpoU family rRNA methylase
MLAPIVKDQKTYKSKLQIDERKGGKFELNWQKKWKKWQKNFVFGRNK